MNAASGSNRGGSPGDGHGRENRLPNGTRFGDFEITGVVGEGGFGIVYAAFDHALHRRIAIKEYMPGALADRMGDDRIVVRSAQHEPTFRAGMRSFINEARLLAAFDDPALLKVFSYWEKNGTAYMAMPLYEGRTLKTVLRDSPKPSEDWLKALLAPLLNALERLHRAECYHRDVAADNIMVLASGAPVLLDFGAARRIIGNMTQDVTVVLKPGYAPIEQYADDPSMQQGPWTDVYAVAAVIYLAITGKPPPTPVTRIVSDTMKPLRGSTSGYSDAFLAAVEWGLAVRPENRPQSIAAFRRALGIPLSTDDTPAALSSSVPVKPARNRDAALAGDGSVVSDVPHAEASSSAPHARNTTAEKPTIGRRPAADDNEATRVLKLEELSGIRAVGSGAPLPQSRSASTAGSPPPAEVNASTVTALTAMMTSLAGHRWKLAVALSLMAGAILVAALAWMLTKPTTPPPAVTRDAVPTGSSPSTSPVADSDSPASTVDASKIPTRTDAAAQSRGEPPREATSTAAGTSASPPGTPGKRDSAASEGDSPAPAERLSSAAVGGNTTVQPPGSWNTGTTSKPAEGAPPPAPPTPAIARTGKVQFLIRPWGEVVVDGKSRGISPPLKELSLAAGRHRIEIRNPGFAGYAGDAVVEAGRSTVVTHSFKSQN